MIKDFFISYSSADRTWANWIAWVLEEHGKTVIVRDWNSCTDKDLISHTSSIATEAEVTVLVLSEHYLKALHAQPELVSALGLNLASHPWTLLPIRVVPCQLTGILASLVYVDLVDKTEAEAEVLLLRALRDRSMPATRPTFPLSVSDHNRVTPTIVTFPQTASGISEKTQTLDSQFAIVSLRSAIFYKLASLPRPQFEQMLFALNPPPGNVPSAQAAQADRVKALLDWTTSVGLDLSEVESIYTRFINLPLLTPAPQNPSSNNPSPSFIHISERLGRQSELLDEKSAPSDKIIQASTKPSTNTSIFRFDTVKFDEKNQAQAYISGQGESYTEKLGESVSLELVKVPAGEIEIYPELFVFGGGETFDGELDIAPDLLNSSRFNECCVSLDAFWIGKYPVTQSQWKAVSKLPMISIPLKRNPSSFLGDLHPVEQISWEEAIEFCARLSHFTGRTYDLLNELEWEYACRAGTKTKYHMGDTISHEYAHFSETHFPESGTCAVDSLNACNGFGLQGMHGNVWEWCSFHPFISSNCDQSSQRVLRGGSWFDGPEKCSSSSRRVTSKVSKDNHIGFRVVSR